MILSRANFYSICEILEHLEQIFKSGLVKKSFFLLSFASKRGYRLSGDPSIVVSDQALSQVLFLVLFVNIGWVVAKLWCFEDRDFFSKSSIGFKYYSETCENYKNPLVFEKIFKST